MKIIFALGNPGPEYTNTRHNTGFMIIDSLATKFDAGWSDNAKFHARTAELKIDGKKVILVKPVTFYNEVGISARKIIDYFKLIPSDDFLVVYDDLALPFGTIRIRQQGSDAGNNGIKSLNSHIGINYNRVRVGTLNELREQMDDSSFVLSKFNANEVEQLVRNITPHVIEIVEQFCAGDLKKDSKKI